jgi:predicted nucleic acid-binding protein
LISSLVSTEGITRTSLAILLHTDNCEVIAPAELSEELRAHSTEISGKAGLTQQQLEEALDRLLENVELVPLSGYTSELKRALKLVRDETDAPFAALALARAPSTLLHAD